MGKRWVRCRRVRRLRCSPTARAPSPLRSKRLGVGRAAGIHAGSWQASRISMLCTSKTHARREGGRVGRQQQPLMRSNGIHQWCRGGCRAACVAAARATGARPLQARAPWHATGAQRTALAAFSYPAFQRPRAFHAGLREGRWAAALPPGCNITMRSLHAASGGQGHR